MEEIEEPWRPGDAHKSILHGRFMSFARFLKVVTLIILESTVHISTYQRNAAAQPGGPEGAGGYVYIQFIIVM